MNPMRGALNERSFGGVRTGRIGQEVFVRETTVELTVVVPTRLHTAE